MARTLALMRQIAARKWKLEEENAKVNQDPTAYVLQNAGCWEHDDHVQKALNLGADIYAQDKNGNTVMHLLASSDLPSGLIAHRMIKFAKMGADYSQIRNNDGQTARDLVRRKGNDSQVYQAMESRVMPREEFMALCQRGNERAIFNTVEQGFIATINDVAIAPNNLYLQLELHELLAERMGIQITTALFERWEKACLKQNETPLRSDRTRGRRPKTLSQ